MCHMACMLHVSGMALSSLGTSDLLRGWCRLFVESDDITT